MTKVVLTVAGHSVEIEAEETLAYCEMTAMDLWRRTSPAAERSGIGFGATTGSYELAPDVFTTDDAPPKRKEEHL